LETVEKQAKVKYLFIFISKLLQQQLELVTEELGPV
jgi:hypothetical protein